MGLIVLLAVGVPLLLLGGCAAVVMVVFSDAGSSRESVVTEADSPNMVLPSSGPASGPLAVEDGTAQQEPAQQQPTEPPAQQEQPTAAVGGTITLAGRDPGLQMAVTVNQVVNPASPAQDFMKPKTGNKVVAVQVTLSNVGQAVYNDSPTNGAMLIDGEGQQYRSTYFDVREGQSYGGISTINTGDTRKGMIVYEVPEGAKLAKFQFGLNSGFAQQKGEWTLG
ncbi:DUF4352 domain-containing protein [Nonomuraea insulae]|uniref:DUF4352 domain-containing protein n=1 Tax=Nonomuraea insulae TaxID=1616787 RepID=A0ABW1CA63_9ACTN